MKHLDITRPKSNGLAEIMVTITGNSFGDQILELKKLRKVKFSGYYETILTEINHEGNHLNDKQIKQWAMAK